MSWVCIGCVLLVICVCLSEGLLVLFVSWLCIGCSLVASWFSYCYLFSVSRFSASCASVVLGRLRPVLRPTMSKKQIPLSNLCSVFLYQTWLQMKYQGLAETANVQAIHHQHAPKTQPRHNQYTTNAESIYNHDRHTTRYKQVRTTTRPIHTKSQLQ